MIAVYNTYIYVVIIIISSFSAFLWYVIYSHSCICIVIWLLSVGCKLNGILSYLILDIIPTRLLNSCIDVLAQPITTLVNLSLSEGIFPDAFKGAVVTPLLKKQSLPKEEFSSYRSISNLNFISKILEKVIHSRLCVHLESFPSLSFQSAYRKFHSTETALTRIHNDLLLAMNRQKVSALILLDLSATFDTIDHKILLDRFHSCFGVSETAHSLLSTESHSVSYCRSSSLHWTDNAGWYTTGISSWSTSLYNVYYATELSTAWFVLAFSFLLRRYANLYILYLFGARLFPWTTIGNTWPNLFLVWLK